MKSFKSNSPIDKVIYNFKGSSSKHIDVVPIAQRLLTTVNKERTTAPHRTDFYRIIWFQQGNPVHTIDFEKISITSPAVLFIHKDRIHRFDKEILHDGKVLIFTDDFFMRASADNSFLINAKIFNGTGYPVLLSDNITTLTALFAQIESEIANREQPFIAEVLYHLLNTLLYTAERLASLQYPSLFINSPDAILVNSFFDLVEINFKKRLSVVNYASLLHVTVNKLNLVLMEMKGKTAKQIVTERLLLEAKRLLAYSELNVKETGFELGFEEPTNFVKFFSKNIGLTPTEFQKTRQ